MRPRAPGQGTPGCTTAMLHSTTTVERDIVYVSGPLAAGSHTIQVTDTSASPIALDSLADSPHTSRLLRWRRRRVVPKIGTVDRKMGSAPDVSAAVCSYLDWR